jgi:hypothetical protein
MVSTYLAQTHDGRAMGFAQSTREEARDDHEICATRNIYGKCKRSRKIASDLLWWEVNYYSDDSAEALTSQAPDG